jgi:acyltransferase
MAHVQPSFETRDLSIDVAKGVGIMLVVFGHTCQNYLVTSYVYSFHMPFFFFLAGLNFNFTKYKEHPAYFLRKRILRLMLPYYLAAFCSYYLYTFLSPTLSLPTISAKIALQGIFHGNGSGLPFNLVLWFLPALFCCEIIFLILCLMLQRFRLFIGVILITISGFILGKSKPLIMGLDIAMTMQFFIYCGFLFRQADWVQKARQSKRDGIINGVAIFSFLLMLLFSATNGRVDLMTRLYGQPIYFLFAGLCGSVALVMACYSFSFSDHHHIKTVLGVTGRASLSIFISHLPISYCIAWLFALLGGYWIYYTFQTYWYILFLLSVTIPVLVYILVVSIWNRYQLSS